MMKYQLIQKFEDKAIRIAGTPDAPLFCAADVCEVLGIANSRDALSRLDADEKANVGTTDTLVGTTDTLVGTTDTPGGPQKMQYVTESGLYHLTFKSRKDAAKRFRRWVTGTVLPEIRRTGAFHIEGIDYPKQDVEKITLTQWLRENGVSLRDDARRASEMLGCVHQASVLLRWHTTLSKGANKETMFQEVPRSVLELAEGIYIQGVAGRRKLPAVQPVLNVPCASTAEERPGGSIQKIIAETKAKKGGVA